MPGPHAHRDLKLLCCALRQVHELQKLDVLLPPRLAVVLAALVRNPVHHRRENVARRLSFPPRANRVRLADASESKSAPPSGSGNRRRQYFPAKVKWKSCAWMRSITSCLPDTSATCVKHRIGVEEDFLRDAEILRPQPAAAGDVEKHVGAGAERLGFDFANARDSWRRARSGKSSGYQARAWSSPRGDTGHCSCNRADSVFDRVIGHISVSSR